jgi:hypothetical protein
MYRMTDIPPDFQRYIFAGAAIEDHQSLADIGAAEGSTLFLVLRLTGSEDSFRNLCRLTSLETGMAVGDVITATFDGPYQQRRDVLDPWGGSPVIRVFGPFHAPTAEATRIKYASYPEVAGVAHYDAATRQAKFTPNAPLAAGFIYAAKVNGEVIPKTFRTAGRTLEDDVEAGNASLGWVHQDAGSRDSGGGGSGSGGGSSGGSSLPDCDYFRAVHRFVKGTFAAAFQGFFNQEQHGMCYCDRCHSARGDELSYDRGGSTYALPLGWARVALDSTRAEVLGAYDGWHPLYHGTSVDAVEGILQTGSLSKAGDTVVGGTDVAMATSRSRSIEPTHTLDRRRHSTPIRSSCRQASNMLVMPMFTRSRDSGWIQRQRWNTLRR